jgi:hypothetical protein
MEVTKVTIRSAIGSSMQFNHQNLESILSNFIGMLYGNSLFWFH